MADPTTDPGADPFQTPASHVEAGTGVDQGHLPIEPVEAGTNAARDRQGNGLAIVVTLALVVVAVGALVLAGYLVWQAADAPVDVEQSEDSDLDDFDLDEYEEWLNQQPEDFPPEITDLDTLTATPGETFTAGYEELVAGEDVSPGIYVAADAVGRSDDDLYFCMWSVWEFGVGDVDGFRVSGSVDEGSAIILLPEGYSFTVTEECGTWEAVDPATVFEGATGTTLGNETHVVGYDLKPGLYLSDEPISDDAECAVWVREHFGFENVHNYGDFYTGRGGTVRLELERGDFVTSHDCPTFTWADPETAYSADAGRTSVGLGAWIVGRDIAPGTYQGPQKPNSGLNWCMVEIWDGNRDWRNAEPVADASYFASEEPAQFTAELGQTVDVLQCEPWERIGP